MLIWVALDIYMHFLISVQVDLLEGFQMHSSIMKAEMAQKCDCFLISKAEFKF